MENIYEPSLLPSLSYADELSALRNGDGTARDTDSSASPNSGDDGMFCSLCEYL